MLKLVKSTHGDKDTKTLMSQSKFYEAYSRWDDDLGRYETWDESVARVMNMHRAYYKDKMTPELSALIDEAEELYKQKYALGAQRALQFGGDQLLKHQMRMYNCTSSYADRPAFFGELFYILLCGAGAGFSVQKHHVAKLPNIAERKKQAKEFTPDDSIEGWADAASVLLSSYFVGGGTHPEYEGRKVYFNLNKIRPKGAMISGGFKAPGPEPLRRALDKTEHLLQGLVLAGETRLRPIHVYDIAMFFADAVLAGGVRRSATICLFSVDDQEMIDAKTGDWYIKNPQRGRSNNSAVVVRSEVTKEQFANLMKSIREFGEPGFYFVNSKEHTTNPCVEIGMFPQIDGVSGWQGCNLTEINGSKCVSREEFFKACRAAAIMGTLQAGYTDFKYISGASKRIFEREALLGVSITGWMNNPQVLFDAEVQREGAELVKAVNKEVAAMIGINPAARTTCVKPSGNASVLLQTASGIHAEHAPRYLRHVQMNKESEVAQLIASTNPYMVEESVWSTGDTDYSIAFPVISKKGSIYRDGAKSVDFLDKVKLVQTNWVEAGTNEDLCADPTVRHNVSNTVTVPKRDWTKVEDYLYENRWHFAGVSFLADSGDKDYNQAPNAQVLTETQIVERYGAAALFASGLIVDTYQGFNNLWDATFVAQQEEEHRGELSDLRADWIRRFNKFADNYFNGDTKEAEYCLKDVYYLHKWTKIQHNLSDIEFETELHTKKFTDVDTMGAIACNGPNGCEITF
jgi:ribonucleoside-triphosphate reductase